MTQHDETDGTATDRQPASADHQAAPLQAVPPSPYLESGGSVPRHTWRRRSQACRSTARHRACGLASDSSAPCASQRGGRLSASLVTSSRGYGRPAGARRAFGAAVAIRLSRRPGSDWSHRVLDWIIIFAVATLAFISPLLQIWRADAGGREPVHRPEFARRTGCHRCDLCAIRRTSKLLLFWFLAMFGIALVYYWVQHAAWGATIGKRALGTGSSPLATTPRSRSARPESALSRSSSVRPSSWLLPIR